MKIRKQLRIMLGVAASVACSQIQAAEVPELAKTKECMSCHAVDKDMPKAPSFEKIAKKYRGVANVEVMLVQKVKVGGVGHWGPNAMPGAAAREQVSDSRQSPTATA